MKILVFNEDSRPRDNIYQDPSMTPSEFQNDSINILDVRAEKHQKKRPKKSFFVDLGGDDFKGTHRPDY